MTVNRNEAPDLEPDSRIKEVGTGVRPKNSPDKKHDVAIKPAISHGKPLREDLNLTTLGAALQPAASLSPSKGLVYIQADGSEVFQTYPSLLREAERIVTGLRKLDLKPQDKIIFQLERNEDFIPAFWGCVLGGYVPVPLPIAPTYDAVTSAVHKLHNAWNMLDKPLILSSTRLASSICALPNLLDCAPFQVAILDELRCSKPDQRIHKSKPDDLAILLLTSGSTGFPKGVQQSHSSLLSRSAGTCQLNTFSIQDVSLNWMPLDHVGGIVMFHIRDVFLGCQQIHVPTAMILENPLKWLDLIEHYRATVTWAPNFAFSLINDMEEARLRRHWDLSSMRFIVNAGETIVAKTARTFLQALRPHGLREDSMFPAWGMSETCSGVTYAHHFSLNTTTDNDQFVEVGSPIPGISMRIVNSQNTVIEEGNIGLLQVKGTSVTSGYFLHPDLNKEVFTADGWFHTGDLGFLKKESLTITGREKDVIIINGTNYYCHEIEAVVEALQGIEISYTAACPVREVENNTDQVAIFFSTNLSDENLILALIQHVRKAVIRNIGVNPTFLIPVEKKDIPKTSIGKIQRTILKQWFSDGKFDSTLKKIQLWNAHTYQFAAPQTELQRTLVTAWQEVLSTHDIGIHDNFLALGGSSIQATQILSRIEHVLKVQLSIHRLFEHPTIESLAKLLEQELLVPSDPNNYARILGDIEALSDEEALALLRKETMKNNKVVPPSQ